jgi:DNA-binding XRE family transcriptional regulator
VLGFHHTTFANFFSFLADFSLQTGRDQPHLNARQTVPEWKAILPNCRSNASTKNKMIAISICPFSWPAVSILPKVLAQRDRKRLGEGVRKYRKRAGLTQERLAEKVDLNPVYVGQIERGFKVPTVEVLVRLARALRVRLRDLVAEI